MDGRMGALYAEVTGMMCSLQLETCMGMGITGTHSAAIETNVV